MMYALNIDTTAGSENARPILSATLAKYGAPGQPIVDFLPSGNLAAYDYNDQNEANPYVFNEARAAVYAAEEEAGGTE